MLYVGGTRSRRDFQLVASADRFRVAVTVVPGVGFAAAAVGGGCLKLAATKSCEPPPKTCTRVGPSSVYVVPTHIILWRMILLYRYSKRTYKRLHIQYNIILFSYRLLKPLASTIKYILYEYYIILGIVIHRVELAVTGVNNTPITRFKVQQKNIIRIICF